MELLESRKGNRVDGQRTICEVHRQIADQLLIQFCDRTTDLETTLELLNEAYLLGIRLVKALVDRKIDMIEWEENDIEQAMKLRQLRGQLVKELNEAGNLLQPAGS